MPRDKWKAKRHVTRKKSRQAKRRETKQKAYQHLRSWVETRTQRTKQAR
jgi:hypothetical protein